MRNGHRTFPILTGEPGDAYVKAMVKAIRRKDRAAALISGKAALAEM
jgi:hypothetical protein